MELRCVGQKHFQATSWTMNLPFGFLVFQKHLHKYHLILVIIAQHKFKVIFSGQNLKYGYSGF